MRGQHRAELEIQHCALDAVGADSEPAQLAHRPARGRRLRIGLRPPQVCVAASDAVRLLGGVDQQKEEREGARRHSALFDGESVDLAQDPIEVGRAALTVTARAGCDTQRLDDLKASRPRAAG